MLRRNKCSATNISSFYQNLPRQRFSHRISATQNRLEICTRRIWRIRLWHPPVLSIIATTSSLSRELVNSVIALDEIHARIALDSSAFDFFIHDFFFFSIFNNWRGLTNRAMINTTFFPASTVFVCITPRSAMVKIRIAAVVVIPGTFWQRNCISYILPVDAFFS